MQETRNAVIGLLQIILGHGTASTSSIQSEFGLQTTITNATVAQDVVLGTFQAFLRDPEYRRHARFFIPFPVQQHLDDGLCGKQDQGHAMARKASQNHLPRPIGHLANVGHEIRAVPHDCENTPVGVR